MNICALGGLSMLNQVKLTLEPGVTFSLYSVINEMGGALLFYVFILITQLKNVAIKPSAESSCERRIWSWLGLRQSDLDYVTVNCHTFTHS